MNNYNNYSSLNNNNIANSIAKPSNLMTTGMNNNVSGKNNKY